MIAVNPYQWYDNLYTEKKRTYYSNRLVWETCESDPRQQMEPHVYEVSALSYKGLAFDGEDQSILVSGESGAGKTETVKICLNHIASVQRGQVPQGCYEDADYDPVVKRVVESNPLLEAFGNAKTRRNDNSSRFGKYLQLQFDKNAHVAAGLKSARCGLVGSKCEVYLLEKNRVVGHDSMERNFHIFYQLLSSPDHEKTRFWAKLAGKTVESFAYVGYTDTKKIEGLSDAEHWQNTVDALELIGVRGNSLDNLMKAIIIVLQLGNLGFEGDADSSSIATQQELSDLADLMGIHENDLTLAFTERTFKTRDETHKVPLGADAAKDACDALAKEAYQKTFLWLVDAINKATCAPEAEGKSYGIVGLLDIFGFEAFKVNRFEQLCINYANEKLQQKFTEDIFRNVQEEYKSEGLDLNDIWYDDNTDVLDLIEGNTGLLALLNEECVRPKGNDLSFVQKALQINDGADCLITHRTDQLSFGIKHYAGAVMYDAEFFVSKNLDILPTDLQECAEKCLNPIINQPRCDTPTKVTSNRPARGRGARQQQSNIIAPSVWTKYKNQLHSLMTNLRKTRSRYIRCIKPNSVKKPELLEHGLVIDQLRSAGVVAGVTISRSVFPNRLDNAVVLARYSNMWDHRNYPSKKTRDMTPEQGRAEDCKALMAGALKPKEMVEAGRVVPAFVVGRTKTYFRAGALEWLESNRMSGLDAQATTLQKYARGWLVRNQGRNSNQRKKFAEEEAARKLAEEQAFFERLKQESADRKAASIKEQVQLQAKLDQLKRDMERAARDHKSDMEHIHERKERLRAENDELKERTTEDARKAAREPQKIVAQQSKKIVEQAKLIKFLKRENEKVRKGLSKYEDKFHVLMSNSQKLNLSNSNFGEAFEHESDETDRVNQKNDELLEALGAAKVANKTLKTRVTEMQDKYMDQAETRLELQKTMARILNMIQDSCKDADIIEDTVVIALECEADAKSEMAALEMETSSSSLYGSTPELQSSDVSHGSYSLSDSFSGQY